MDYCSIQGCERPARTDSLCKMHYERRRKTGTTDPNPKYGHAPLEERLWRNVSRRGPDECWPWIGKALMNGYGYIGNGNGRSVRAHRVSWELANGPIPVGEGAHGTVVMHLCDNRLCCNPAHMRLGTQAENLADMRRKGRNRGPIGETHFWAKLTEADVREIRQSVGSHSEVAERYGVHARTIYDIRRRTAWKHVT